MVINELLNLLNLLQRILGEDFFVIHTLISKVSGYDLPGMVVHASYQTVVYGPRTRGDVSNELVVRMVKINQVRGALDQDLLDLFSSNTIVELNTRSHLNLTWQTHQPKTLSCCSSTILCILSRSSFSTDPFLLVTFNPLPYLFPGCKFEFWLVNHYRCLILLSLGLYVQIEPYHLYLCPRCWRAR